MKKFDYGIHLKKSERNIISFLNSDTYIETTPLHKINDVYLINYVQNKLHELLTSFLNGGFSFKGYILYPLIKDIPKNNKIKIKNLLRILEHLNNKNFNLAIADLNAYGLTNEDEIKNSINKMYELFPYPKSMLQIYPVFMHNALNESLVKFSTSKKLSKKIYNLCHHPWVEMVIDYKGNVVACCRDLRSEYIIGNILECSDIKKKIWNGEKMRDLRTHLAKKEPGFSPTN